MSDKKQINIKHIIIGGSIGNLTEWYDFLLYSYLASTISQLFFPTDNKILSLTLAFTVFALSFFVRPLGGILFGWIGDVYGRQRALVISLSMMAIPTFLIGCLPAYQSIGILSPILLCLFRICQGLSAGGEHTGAAVYLSEYAPSNKRAFWVSTVPTSAALGILISSIIALIIINSFNAEQLLSFGWRIGYWFGTVLCIISILLRITMPETPYFQKHHQNVRYPLSQLLSKRENIKKLFIVISLASSWGIFYQILFIWMPTFLTHINHLEQATALIINSVFILIFACLILLVGYLADFVNRIKLIKISCAAMLLFAYPLFLLLASGLVLPTIIAIGIFTFIFSLYLPTTFVTMIEIFNTNIRYTGLSFGFNLGLAIFGGTCPLVVTWLIEITGNTASPAYYMMLASLTAYITITLLHRKDFKLISNDISAKS